MAQPQDNAADTATRSAVFEAKDSPFQPVPPIGASEAGALPRVGLLRRLGIGRTATDEPDTAADAYAPKPKLLSDFLPRQVPLAASVALALALGVALGAGATLSLQRDAPSAAPAASAASSRDVDIATATHRLQENVARLRSEIAAIKAGIDAAQFSATAEFGKLAEGLARLDQRQAALPAPSPAVTGSVTTVAKQEPKPEPKLDAKPPLAEGWRLLDYYAGRAVVETPAGRLFDVGAGSNLPGLGRVQSIKREDGQVVLTARNGVVAGALDPRRPTHYRPYR
jgi:hypothetical protein